MQTSSCARFLVENQVVFICLVRVMVADGDPVFIFLSKVFEIFVGVGEESLVRKSCHHGFLVENEILWCI